MSVKRFVLVKWYSFKYRKVDNDVCCCGSRDCSIDCSHAYVSAKEYAIYSAVNKRMKKGDK